MFLKVVHENVDSNGIESCHSLGKTKSKIDAQFLNYKNCIHML